MLIGANPRAAFFLGLLAAGLLSPFTATTEFDTLEAPAILGASRQQLLLVQGIGEETAEAIAAAPAVFLMKLRRETVRSVVTVAPSAGQKAESRWSRKNPVANSNN